MIKSYRGLKILAVAAAVPPAIREMRDLQKYLPDTDCLRIIKKTGIERTRISTEDTTTGDLCYAAATQLFEECNVDPKSIDALIFSSCSPDYLFPPTSPLLQARLRLSTSIVCQDIPLTCSGYTHGLLQAALLISSGTARRILLLAGDTPTKFFDPKDRSLAFLFGDAGSATLIEADENYSGVFGVETDGDKSKLIYGPNTGMRKSEDGPKMVLAGLEMLNTVCQRVPDMIRAVVEKAGVSLSEIDQFLFHQPNQMILDRLATHLSIEKEKVPSSLKNFGNTGAASIPLNLVATAQAARDKVILCGFGAGFSISAVQTSLSQTHLCRIHGA